MTTDFANAVSGVGLRCDEKPGPVKCGRDARLEQGNLG